MVSLFKFFTKKTHSTNNYYSRKQIKAILKVTLLSLLPVVALILINLFSSYTVSGFLEPKHLMNFILFLELFPSGSLLLLKSMLFRFSQVIISILKCPLIWSQPAISRWQLLNHISMQIVQLPSKHTEVELFTISFRKRLAFPDLDLLLGLSINNSEVRVPLGINSVSDLSSLIFDVTSCNVSIAASPASLLHIKDTRVTSSDIVEGDLTMMVDVHLTKNNVLN
mmetsp:Transcript_8897/g.7866  ORF Transcript_8897/g.7866 Transcript_8897/m.7866 type:complete len:224 (+) Transcript_8897:123-794(+)